MRVMRVVVLLGSRRNTALSRGGRGRRPDRRRVRRAGRHACMQMCVGLDARRRQNPDGFTCNDGSIIPWSQVCDVEAQCDCKCDESDAICVDNPPPSPSPTPVDGFTCNDGSIIPWAQVCDGEPQCDCECDESESACKQLDPARRRAETLTPALPVSQIDDQTPEEVL